MHLTCAHCGKFKPNGHCRDNCEEVAHAKDRQEMIRLLQRIEERLAGGAAVGGKKWFQFWK